MHRNRLGSRHRQQGWRLHLRIDNNPEKQIRHRHRDQCHRRRLSGTYELLLRARPGQAARTAKLQVRHGALRVPPPAHRSPYLKRINPDPIEMHVVHVLEVDAPQGTEPIEWILPTSLNLEDFEGAWVVVGYYEKRWLIEEWHKALKTG